MNFLSGAMRYVAGADAEPHNNIPRLIDRIKTSALSHDRRAAIIQLTEAAKQSPTRQAHVGESALKIIYAVLEQDIDYDDTIKSTLELLIAVCAAIDPPTSLSSDPAARHTFETNTRNAAVTNIDAFLGLPNSLSMLLQLVDKPHFYVKFGTIELLTAMSANSPETLQAAILETPQGVARICDVLEDSHRHIRYNAVLLLSTLCHQSPEICKIVVYGSVLEKLFALIDSVTSTASPTQSFDPDDPDDDDTVENAIVVQDVLIALRNLINGTPTTKTFFRDSGCLPRLISVLQRAASDASFTLSNPSRSPTPTPPAGVKVAIQQQARKNLLLSMQCVSGLVSGSDEESRLNKAVLASTNLFNVLASIAFSQQTLTGNDTQASKPSATSLQVRVSALTTMAILVRAHADFRAMFSSTSYTAGGNGVTPSAQLSAQQAMCRNHSAAMRLASYMAFRESFVSDAGLDLPSSALINALTNSGGSSTYALSENRGASYNSHSTTQQSPASTDTLVCIAETLKDTIVGWPTSSDGAGVFYSAMVLSWVAAKGQDARERLLGCYVNGSSLLPSIMRTLGKLQREKGPAEVRVSLFSLVCVWLHNSPSALSTFLSSAMHLPMIVDILQANGSRGDAAEVHVRGLACVLLGICLQACDAAADSVTDGGFLSGGSGASVSIPRSTIADVIRSRIGVTVFTSCLDELRATKAFTRHTGDFDIVKFAETLCSREERDGFLSENGSLGHDMWYQSSLISVVDNVYEHVGAKALDLVSEPQPPVSLISRSSPSINGHMSESAKPGREDLLADSTTNEVIKSYKEFIRTQDESLSSARHQIEELSTALREAQVELDAKTKDASAAQQSAAIDAIRRERDEVVSQKQALESLLAEKSADFESLSNVFARLEAEQSSQEHASSAPESDEVVAELQRLRTQLGVLQQTLDSEMGKNMQLSQKTALLEEMVRRKDAEIRALSNESDAMKANVHPEAAEALQWRTRAELAESSLQARQQALENAQSSSSELQAKLADSELARDEALSASQMLQVQLTDTKSELENIRALRQRELQVSRESSATSAAAHSEIETLKSQLAESQQSLIEARKKVAEQDEGRERETTAENDDRVQRLQVEYGTLVKSMETLRAELQDSNQAVTQWQKRAKKSDAEKERHSLEANRLTNACRDLDDKTKSLQEALVSQEHISTAANNRVKDLEQQCAELETQHAHDQQESKELKKELAVRTEQSIRLSGEMYEMEDAKTRMETEVQSLKEILRRTSENMESTTRDLEASSEALKVKESGVAEEEDLRRQLDEARAELGNTKDALADSRDRESLIRAQAEDRDAALSRAESLEEELKEAQAKLLALEEELNSTKERLLSLDEAEDAKRTLTLQVGQLQEALNQQSVSGFETNSQASRQQQEALEARLVELEAAGMADSRRVEELETTLSAERDMLSSLEQDRTDMAKQVEETNVVLSVLKTERDRAVNEADDLKTKLTEKTVTEDDVRRIDTLYSQLQDAEQKRDAASKELSSLVEACKLSENETVGLRENMKSLEREREELQNKNQSLDLEAAQLRKETKALTSEMNDAGKKYSALELEKSEILERNESLANEVSAMCNEVRTAQARAHYLALSQDVGSTLQALIADVSLSTSVSSASKRIDEIERERDALRESVEVVTDRLTATATDLEKHAALSRELTHERDAARQNSEEEASRAAQLVDEVARLRSESIDREVLQTSLQSARETVDRLTSELAAAKESQRAAEMAVEDATPKHSAHNNNVKGIDEKAQKRIKELEDALRDAARTVSATNLELISAQTLLVELSSDKTAMRAELTSAEEQIHKLTKQVLKSSATKVDSSMSADVSEVSEVEPSIPDDEQARDVSQEDTKLMEEQLRGAETEVSNLRTALHRTIHEADTASDVLSTIFEKIGVVEESLRDSHSSLESAKDVENALNEELKSEREATQREKQQLEEKLSSVESERSSLRAQLDEAQTRDSENSIEVSRLRRDIPHREEVIKQLREEKDALRQDADSRAQQMSHQIETLQKDVEEKTNAMEDLRERTEDAEARTVRLSSNIKVAEKETEDLRESLKETVAREEDIRKQLTQIDNLLKKEKEEHQKHLDDHSSAWDKRSTEHKEAVEQCNKALEVSEARFQTERESLTSELSTLTAESGRVTAELETSNAELRSCEQQLDEVNVENEEIRKEMEEARKKHADELHMVKTECKELGGKVRTLEGRKEELEASLHSAQEEKEKLSKTLEDEVESRAMLETENQDFAQSTEWLEQRCQRLDVELRTSREQSDEFEKRSKNLADRLGAELATVGELKEELHLKEEAVRDAGERMLKAEGEIKALKKQVEAKETECSELNQDNNDLRAWVGDLERQADELQNAASDFEGVEQSLRDTLATQRQQSEQITRLSEEVRQERDQARGVEVRARKAERERAMAEEGRAAAEERVGEVERRLAEIREASVAKLSASEAGIRGQAQRCAELETALAEAQRQVAELGAASDAAFAAQAEVRRARDEVGAMRERLEEAESKVEVLEGEVRAAREEVDEVRGATSSEAYKVLEAEHNELLVYLADLELELTGMKEGEGEGE